jgi:hypothetical protein
MLKAGKAIKLGRNNPLQFGFDMSGLTGVRV